MSLRFDFVTECALLVANDAHSGSMVRNLYSMVRVAEAPQFGSSASEKSELPKVRAGLLKTHGFRPHLNPLVPVPDWPRSNGYS